MSLRNQLAGIVRPFTRSSPKLHSVLAEAELNVERWRHSAAQWMPSLIKADPRSIFVTLTANCNLRCIGCRYGRDFMPGQTLPLQLVRNLLDDAAKLGIRNIRLYGGEPLLHKDLVKIVEHGVGLGLDLWLTTNGILLQERIDDLYAAGLRHIGIGFYGTGDEYDAYVQRKDRYARLEAGIAYARDRYGDDLKLSLGWVLMKPTCSVAAVEQTFKFAERYDAQIGVNLVHYSLPYFTEGPDQALTFRPEDRPQIEAVVEALLRLKALRPDLIEQSPLHLRSIPDWLIRRSEMRVPCDRYKLLWVGADGTLQLCYVTFKLGNLHEQRLSEMLFTPAHEQAARDAFQLNCPNCNCSFGTRTDLHAPSRQIYS